MMDRHGHNWRPMDGTPNRPTTGVRPDQVHANSETCCARCGFGPGHAMADLACTEDETAERPWQLASHYRDAAHVPGLTMPKTPEAFNLLADQACP